MVEAHDAMMAQTFACKDVERRPVAVSNSTGRYSTWSHASYRTRDDSVSRTLCGKRFYDPSVDAGGWQSVNCSRCQRSIARLNRLEAQHAAETARARAAIADAAEERSTPNA